MSITLQLHYSDNKSETINTEIVKIFHNLEGEIAIHTNHMELKGIGETLSFDGHIHRGEFMYYVHHNKVDVYFL
jgi:hypothetical protein